MSGNVTSGGARLPWEKSNAAGLGQEGEKRPAQDNPELRRCGEGRGRASSKEILSQAPKKPEEIGVHIRRGKESAETDSLHEDGIVLPLGNARPLSEEESLSSIIGKKKTLIMGCPSQSEKNCNSEERHVTVGSSSNHSRSSGPPIPKKTGGYF